jgi:hypothetical protein
LRVGYKLNLSERQCQMSRAKHAKLLVSVLLLLIPRQICGQESPSNSEKLLIPNSTPVRLRFANTICSSSAHTGDRVEFVVERDVNAGGLTVVAAGSKALGSVVEVKSRRVFGMGGGVVIKLDSVELANGVNVNLMARKRFKGRSHTLRMGLEMAVASAIYLPVAPVFLLSRGRDSTILKGTEITAFTQGDASVLTAGLPKANVDASDLPEMVKLMPARALNGEGREGDMLNLIFVAKEDDLQAVFARAGWVKVEKSKPQIIWHLFWQREKYKKLPMDRLYVFGRAQDYSYALPEPGSIVSRRHHLRIWRTDRQVDGVPLWVAAATHDVGIEFVKRKLWLFHKIDPDVDLERDFIAANLAKTQQFNRREYVRGVDAVVDGETATGQAYFSDSRMLLIGLNPIDGSMAAPADSGNLR